MSFAFRRRALEQIDAAATYYEREHAGLGAGHWRQLVSEGLVRRYRG